MYGAIYNSTSLFIYVEINRNLAKSGYLYVNLDMYSITKSRKYFLRLGPRRVQSGLRPQSLDREANSQKSAKSKISKYLKIKYLEAKSK